MYFFRLAIVLSVLHRYTDSDYPFGIFKLSLLNTSICNTLFISLHLHNRRCKKMIIKTWISNLVRTTRFWNKIHFIFKRRKDWSNKAVNVPYKLCNTGCDDHIIVHGLSFLHNVSENYFLNIDVYTTSSIGW